MTTDTDFKAISKPMEERFLSLGETVEEIRENFPIPMKKWNYLENHYRSPDITHCPLVELTHHFLEELGISTDRVEAGFTSVLWKLGDVTWHANVPRVWHGIVCEENL